ncbi:hypothetical protein [Nonomuraea rosea]|uniref:hypothetical protein n=1 Tax=Nonomuraea rosea TaxID=638574 RepID=UPI0031EBC3E9
MLVDDRITLDRLSVIKSLANALDVSLGDLLAEPHLFEWTDESGDRTIPALRAAITDYRQLSPMAELIVNTEPSSLASMKSAIDEVWRAYQGARYSYVIRVLPALVGEAHHAARIGDGDARLSSLGVLGQVYHAAASILTKVGEADLAWIAAERGLTFARESGDQLITASLLRCVTHALLANGRHGSQAAHRGRR